MVMMKGVRVQLVWWMLILCSTSVRALGTVTHCVWRDAYVCHRIHRGLMDKIFFPTNACVIEDCTHCISGMKTMLLTQDRQLVEPKFFELSQKFQHNGRTQFYDCLNDKEHCSCSTDRMCNGTKQYCETMTCDTSSNCFCKIEKATSTLTHKDKTRVLTNPELINFFVCLMRKPQENTSHVAKHRLRRRILEENDATFEENGLRLNFNEPIITLNQPGTLIVRINGLEKIYFMNLTNSQVVLPADFLRFKGTIDFIMVNLKGKSISGKFQVQGLITCRTMDCIFCREAIEQLECLPKYISYAIIMGLIILTVIAILYIRIILYVVYSMGYIIYFTLKQTFRITRGVSRLSLVTGATIGDKLRNIALRVNAVIDRHARVNPAVAALVLLTLFAVVAGDCNNHMIMKTKNSDCTELDGELTCKLETQVQVTLENFGFQQCLWLQDEKRNTLIQLKITLEKASCMWHSVKEYFTFFTEWRMLHQVICPQNFMCSWGSHCLKSRQDFPAMTEESKNYPGFTSCYAGDSGSSSCTIIDSQSCHFYRIFLIPDYLRTYEVRRIIGHECTYEVAVQEIGNATTEHVKLRRVAVTNKGIRLQIVGAFDQAHTVTNFHLISRVGNTHESYVDVVSPVGRPTSGSIGDVQSNSSISKDFIFDKKMFQCNFYEDLASCTRDESYLATLVETKANALPRTIGYHTLNVDEEGRLKSNLLVTQPVVVSLTLQDYEVHVKTSTVCPKFTEDDVKIQGCYACNALARITIQAVSTCERGTVSVEFEVIKVATRAVQLDTEVKTIIIEFHSEVKCIRDKLCLQAKTLKTCKIIKFCLTEGDILLRHPNISHITSLTSMYNPTSSWDFPFISGLSSMGAVLQKGVLVIIAVVLMFFLGAMMITCCRGR